MPKIKNNYYTTKITLIKTHIQKTPFRPPSVEAKQKNEQILSVLTYMEEAKKTLANFGEKLKNQFNINTTLQEM